VIPFQAGDRVCGYKKSFQSLFQEDAFEFGVGRLDFHLDGLRGVRVGHLLPFLLAQFLEQLFGDGDLALARAVAHAGGIVDDGADERVVEPYLLSHVAHDDLAEIAADADGQQPARGDGLLYPEPDGGAVGPAWGVNSEYGRLHDVLLCEPVHFEWLPTSSISRATLRSGAKFDRQLALKQHREMVQAYEDAGVTVHYLETDEALPYQVYARDSSFMTPYGAVVTQMHQWWRRGEYAPVIRFYQSRGIPIFKMVTAAAFEGGDFDVIEPGAVLIGYCGERTQEPAARQVKGWMEEKGWEVKLAPIAEHYVHIDLMVCMLAPKMAAVCPDITDDRLLDWLRSKDIEMVPVDYRDTMELGCNVMSLGDGKIISTARSKALNRTLRAAGFSVYDPDMTMFTMGGGGVHCMAQALRRDPV